MWFGVAQLANRLKSFIPALLILPLMVFAVLFMAMMPSGSETVIGKYQTDVAAVDPNIVWQDVYMFDYFKYGNDFSNVTDDQIKADARLFVYKVTTKDSKGKTHTQTAYKSLYDVMTAAGYSRSDYDMALQLETLYGSTTSSTGLTGMPVKVVVKQLEYEDIPAQLLYQYVQQRGSVFTLSDIETIENAAKQYDVNPALMVAITGQELSFIPADSPNAAEMELNPFDVECPGQSGPGNYATCHVSLQESADIAANTLAHKLSTPPPSGEDPIAWINDPKNPWGIYAKDQHWSYGVEDFFASIMQFVGKPLPTK